MNAVNGATKTVVGVQRGRDQDIGHDRLRSHRMSKRKRRLGLEGCRGDPERRRTREDTKDGEGQEGGVKEG